MQGKDMDLYPRPELFDFHGVSMVSHFTDNWEETQNFQARPDDVLLASYPKAGSTWLSYILDLLYFGQTSPERQTSVPIYRRVPVLELAFSHPQTEPGSTPHIYKGTEILDNLPTSPRLIKTHLPVQFMPKSFWEQNCKMVYVARNAKDSVVSFFHFERMTLCCPEPEDWDNYLQRFMKGQLMCGSWYDHVNGWWKKKETYSKLHFMFYEDLVENTRREIDRLCHFLGLSPSAEEKEIIAGRVKFDKMKTNNMVNYSTFKMMDFNKSSFIRKGKVGDWKNHFTVAQNEEFEEDYKKKMKDSTLQFHTVI
uniref:cytosolic sulfotransferase 3-like isoform X2 n=1 Tax=Scatophagus argus TaxID=75038 RepID=UPI001ED8348F|nr:cytosolic sulfotransferase 3-like isoform X2 [Scatophagus argus]